MARIGPPDAHGPRLQRSEERQGERAQGVSVGDRGGEPLDSLSGAAVQGMSLFHIFHHNASILSKTFMIGLKCTFFARSNRFCLARFFETLFLSDSCRALERGKFRDAS